MKIYIKPSTRVEKIIFEVPCAQDTIHTSFSDGDDEGDGDDAAAPARESDDFKWGESLW